MQQVAGQSHRHQWLTALVVSVGLDSICRQQVVQADPRRDNPQPRMEVEEVFPGSVHGLSLAFPDWSQWLEHFFFLL
jgi:hypothetical protein